MTKCLKVGALMLICLPAAATAQVSETNIESLRDCLQQQVTISAGSLEKARYIGHTLTADVTNNLPWALAGVRIGYEIYSEGRSVPWLSDSTAMSVPGGIEPGETRSINITAYLSADAPAELLPRLEILDVSDQDERQLIRDVRVIGWAEETSSRRCE